MGHKIITRIWNCVHKHNKNFLIIILGPTGSGKSYSALRIAECLDPKFSIDKVVFTSEDFMNLLNSGKLKKGNVIIFDECGVSVSNREWYTMRNKMIMYILQTFRYLNLVVIFTTPAFAFLDTHARKLIHATIETLAIDENRNEVITKFKELQTNSIQNKTYFKYPKMKTKEGKLVKITRLRIPLPSKELINDYEEKSQLFKNALSKDTSIALDENKKKNIKRFFNPKAYAEEILKNKDEFFSKHNKRTHIDVYKIQNKYGVGKDRAIQIKRSMEAILFNIEKNKTPPAEGRNISNE